MKSTIIKRSIVLNGRKTSVSLEAEFWDSLREIACAQKINLTEAGATSRPRPEGNNFSSAIRVFVFNHLRAQIARLQTSQKILPERPMEQRRLSA